MVRFCSSSSREVSADAPDVVTIVFFIGSGGVSTLVEVGFSGVSNLISFRSGSGFFSFCSLDCCSVFISLLFCNGVEEFSLEDVACSFSNFNFI